MKSIAVMQPYLFPYLGYFQLMQAVDEFVFFDDANYIKRGWVNRNRILLQGNEHRFSLPLIKASQNKKINEIAVNIDDRWRSKFMRSVEAGYKKAPQFELVAPMLEQILYTESENLAHFIARSFERINAYLELATPLVSASKQFQISGLKGPEKIIEICKLADAKIYVNPVGGSELYCKRHFLESGLHLKFLTTLPWKYKQRSTEFIANLSIIDVLMNVPTQEVHKGILNHELN
jgi:hypothetical protein